MTRGGYRSRPPRGARGRAFTLHIYFQLFGSLTRGHAKRRAKADRILELLLVRVPAMLMYLYALVLSMCSALVPATNPVHRHGALATAISSVVTTKGPLFKDDKDGKKTAALMVAVAFRESTLSNDVVGDKGKSYCAFQIHASSGGVPELCSEPMACAEKAYAMLKESIRIDPDHPVAFYARGPGYRTFQAVRISNDRMMLAKKLASIPF